MSSLQAGAGATRDQASDSAAAVNRSAAGSGGRAQPFYCPYCGEADIRPDDDRGVYRCEVCDRLWALSYRGRPSAGAT